MRLTLLSASFALMSAPVLAQDLPFLGTWDCSVAIFSFTGTIYNNGSENMEITDISADGTGHILTFADDYQLSVAVNPDGTLNWFSPDSGDSFTCTRVN